MSESVVNFEKATRKKYRFNFRGIIGVEDLWDLSMPNLNSIYKGLISEKKENDIDSLEDTKADNSIIEEINDKIELVKYIYNTKKAEYEARVKEQELIERKKRIMEIIKNKEDESLQNLPIEELQKLLLA